MTNCRICSAQTSSTHFGIDACRACSSFYKRAILSGRRYPCREGGLKCTLSRDDSQMCRRCRFDKCEAAGMSYDGPLRSAKKKSPEKSESSSPIPSETSVIKKSPPTETLVDRVAREHEACITRRREREWSAINRTGLINELKKIEHPTHELFMANNKQIMQMLYISLEEAYRYYRCAFPMFEHLPLSEQRQIYRVFITRYSVLEGFLLTQKIWGSANTRYAMCSVLTCVDLQSPETWLGPDEGGANRSTLLECVQSYITLQWEMFVPILQRSSITDREMHSLIALNSCDPESIETCSDDCRSLLEKMRSEVLTDLHHYYRNTLGLREYSQRLGNLLTMCHVMKESSALFQEYLRMNVAIFDMYASETVLHDLYL